MLDVQPKNGRSFEGLSIRAMVLLGFILIFVLWLAAWAQLSMQLGEAQKKATATNQRYIQAQETLANIRARVLLSSVAFRDALLDPDPANIERYRDRLNRHSHEIDGLIGRYVPMSDSESERAEFARLRAEIEGYRFAISDVLASDHRSWLAEARNLLALKVTPQREIVIAISESAQALNRSAYMHRQEEIAGIYHSVQRTFWELLGLALMVGLGVAVTAVVYAGRLERRLLRQMAKGLQQTRDLQDLSAKVVSVQEEERRHIARELHDEIGQALTAIKVELMRAQNSIEARSGPSSLLYDARAITDGALHQVRDLSYLLHPAALDEFGLAVAVDSYVQTFGRRHNLVAILFNENMSERLSPEVEVTAYRIIQEALTNVAKHAAARACWVHLGLNQDVLKIRIEDDGTGFDPTVVQAGDRRGLGLIGIRERVAHLKGTVNFESGRAGTRLSVELPVRLRMVDKGPELIPESATA